MPAVITSDADLEIIGEYKARRESLRMIVAMQVYPTVKAALKSYADFYADLEPGGRLELAASLHGEIAAAQPEGFNEALEQVLSLGAAFVQAISAVDAISPGTFPGCSPASAQQVVPFVE